MGLFTARALIPFIGTSALLVLAGCGKVQGAYQGVVTGSVTIGAPLHGGGPLSGRRDGKTIEFTTSDGAGGRIVWIGKVEGDTLEGQYVVEPTSFFVPGKQQGEWSVTK